MAPPAVPVAVFRAAFETHLGVCVQCAAFYGDHSPPPDACAAGDSLYQSAFPAPEPEPLPT
jgi:hypothetical protein